jgi:hypothetical protein
MRRATEANPKTISIYVGNEGKAELVAIRALLALHTSFFEGYVTQKRFRDNATGIENLRDVIQLPPELSKPDIHQLMYWICNRKLRPGEDNSLNDPNPASLW